MKKLLLLLILSIFSIQGFAGGCPDGSEPVKSVSDDGTYFVYNCGGSSSVDNKISGTVKVAMKPDSGDWLNESIYPLRLKVEMLVKMSMNTTFRMNDFDKDGVDDVFHLGVPPVSGLIQGAENPDITNSTACDPNSALPCWHSKSWLSVFSMKNDVTYRIWDGEKQDWVIKTGPSATDVSHLLVNNNPIEMNSQESNGMSLADFNGDDVVDIFVKDGGMRILIGGKGIRPGKNDLYFLSQPDGTWLESTSTHVTGTGVQKGKGLIKFTHGASTGDIDGDGDIDVVVTSTGWVGNNGEIFCYVNQGDGHMKVRRCGDQFGFEVELGDIDNDGDLDVAFGGDSHAAYKEWKNEDGLGQCHGLSSCPRAYNGILLNDGTGNFYERGFEFDDVVSPHGFTYPTVPNISVSDLDGDGDLDVVRMHVQRLYHGAAMTIEENIGDGQFKRILTDHWCDGPKAKADWGVWEGSKKYGCWASNFAFGDFNKDGLVDIVVNGGQFVKSPNNQKYDTNHRIIDGTVYLSTGKFKYDIVRPDDDDYPLVDFGMIAGSIPKENATQQEIEDELAAFEAELAAELGQ